MFSKTSGRCSVRSSRIIVKSRKCFRREGALIAHCPPYLQDMIVFALNTGLRCGDIFKLNWEEVNFEERR